jgi:hypothetical protein
VRRAALILAAGCNGILGLHDTHVGELPDATIPPDVRVGPDAVPLPDAVHADARVGPDAPPGTCTAAAGLVYVIDDTSKIYRYDTTAGTYALITALSCSPAASLPSYPGPPIVWSAAVDRSGKAWVMYTSGQIFWVDLNVANPPCAAMTPSWTVGTMGFELFSTAFRSDVAGGATEKLFIAGGKADLSTSNFGVIDPVTIGVTTIGAVPAQLRPVGSPFPMLTGTGNGELFAYAPNLIAQINPTSGTITQSWTMPTPLPTSSSVSSWAIAHGAGKLYVFVTTTDTSSNQNSQVYTLDPSSSTNTGQLVAQNTGHNVYAAMSSTCVP